MSENDKKKDENIKNGGSKYKCYNCGKSFPDNPHLKRHKNRKTPCLIQDVKPENVRNPNKCHYCNKIFQCKQNLLRHFRTCKIKNGGVEILYGKIIHEQQMQEELDDLKKQLTNQKKDADERLEYVKKQEEKTKKKLKKKLKKQSKQQTETMTKVLERMDNLEKELKKANPVATPQTIQNNNTQNNTQQINIEIKNETRFVLRNYLDPKVGPPLTRLEILAGVVNCSPISEYACRITWFDPKTPENHSVIVLKSMAPARRGRKSSKKPVDEDETNFVILCFDGEKWCENPIALEELDEVITEKIFPARIYGDGCIFNDSSWDKHKKTLSGGFQRAVCDTIQGTRKLKMWDMKNYVNNREMVKEAVVNGLESSEVKRITSGSNSLI
jgi:hypothetical protein